jgi:hypothetical protein
LLLKEIGIPKAQYALPFFVEDASTDLQQQVRSSLRPLHLLLPGYALGKTIEAGLVAQELILRHRARTILIVCPSSIQMQRKEEIREQLGLEFRIVDSELFRDLRRRRGIHVPPGSSCLVPVK